MSVPYRFLIKKPTHLTQSKIEQMVAATFARVDAIFNNWNENSEISRLNRAAAYEKIIVSKELQELFSLVDKHYQSSDGRFDPTVGALVNLWQDSQIKNKEVKAASWDKARLEIGWPTIHREGNFVWKEYSGTKIDLCAIAKGHLVDLVARELKEAGVVNGYIEWGGEIKTIGSHPAKRPWQVGIALSEVVVALQDQALATSGNYLQRAWMRDENGERHCTTHIMDPKRGRPLVVGEGAIVSASVVATSCADADAIATTLMLFETASEAIAWANTLDPPVQVWVGSGDGS